MSYKHQQFIFWGLGLLIVLMGCKKKDYRMNGTYMPYKYEKQNYTKPPEGFEPFYINYVGRHGSRYPVSDNDIRVVYDILKQAELKGALSNKGKDLLITLEEISRGCQGKWGELSKKGVKQLQGISQRIWMNYPNIFKDHIFIHADESPRCEKSMEAFLDEFLKRLPKLQLSIDILPEDNPVLNFFDLNKAYINYQEKGPWRHAYHDYVDRMMKYDRPIRDLVIDNYGDTIIHKSKFIHALYGIYAILPNTDLNISLSDYFTGDEIFTLWNIQNVRQYLEKGPSLLSNGLQIDISFPLLADFLETSTLAIKDQDRSADFRFAHAETIIPFAAFMDIPEASAHVSDLNEIDKYWLNFEVAPMAANIQWIFYKNESGKYLVKFLLNEKEVTIPIPSNLTPYYDWENVKNYYQHKINKLPITPSLSLKNQVASFKIPNDALLND